jgi:glycosyltransferase involved in cell wall biosynthesis
LGAPQSPQVQEPIAVTPRASIVIPLLREPPEWLEQCVRSALAQSAVSEVIVVASPHTPDELRVALRRWSADAPRLGVLVEEGTGFAAALNTGIRASRTSHVGFLLADDWLESSAVECCLAHDADIVSSGLRVWSDDGHREFLSLQRRPTQSIYDGLSSIERKAGYLEHFFLFRREALLAVGGVDETIGSTGADDFDLIWTMLKRDATVTVIPDLLYNYRDHHGERLTLRPAALQRRDLARILDKHGVRGDARERMLRDHEVWFGAPVHVVEQRLRASTERTPT